VPSILIKLKDLQDMHITDIRRLYQPLFPIKGLLVFPMPESKKKRLINALATCESGICSGSLALKTFCCSLTY
jgi:hypothetical protein